MKSQYVMYEWSFAWGARKRVVPILYKAVDEQEIHPRLDKRQYLNFTQRSSRQWDELIQRIREIEKISQIHVPFPSNPQKFEPKVEKLIHEITSGNENVRISAIKMLKNVATSAMADRVVGFLRSDSSWEVRATAAQILGEIGNAQNVIDLLIVLQADDDIDVVCYTAEALGKLGDEIAVQPLIEKLNEVQEETSTWGELAGVSAGQIIIEALKKIGTDEALKTANYWYSRWLEPPPNIGDIPF